MLQESWFKFYGRPETVITDPEGCFRERLFREWLASKNAKWDPQLVEAARIEILDKVLDVLKNAATRAARRAPERHLLARFCLTIAQRLITSYTVGEVIHLSSWLIGRSPAGLPLDGDKQLGESECVAHE